VASKLEIKSCVTYLSLLTPLVPHKYRNRLTLTPPWGLFLHFLDEDLRISLVRVRIFNERNENQNSINVTINVNTNIKKTSRYKRNHDYHRKVIG
jgi:hypothetical protein